MLSPIPITLFRSMLGPSLIRFPADGDISAPRAFVGGKMPLPGRWGMSRRKPIKEFPTTARKTTFASGELRYTSQRASGSAPASRNQKARIYYYLSRGTFVVLFQ